MVKKVLDGTDAFDARLEVLNKGNTPPAEIDAAIAVYERLRSARAMAQALLPEPFSEAAVVALAVEMGAESRASKN